VNERAGAVERMVGGVVGELIRGIRSLSFNNEAIAKASETALGVTARKAAEKFAWCYAACGGRKGLPARIGHGGS
jgi:predicted ATPase